MPKFLIGVFSQPWLQITRGRHCGDTALYNQISPKFHTLSAADYCSAYSVYSHCIRYHKQMLPHDKAFAGCFVVPCRRVPPVPDGLLGLQRYRLWIRWTLQSVVCLRSSIWHWNAVETSHYWTLTAYEYDAIEEFNVDSKADCGQLNLAHVARKNKKAVLSQRWPRYARYISRSWAVAEIWPFEIMQDGGHL